MSTEWAWNLKKKKKIKRVGGERGGGGRDPAAKL